MNVTNQRQTDKLTKQEISKQTIRQTYRQIKTYRVRLHYNTKSFEYKETA